jgi:hypothetical protein
VGKEHVTGLTSSSGRTIGQWVGMHILSIAIPYASHFLLTKNFLDWYGPAWKIEGNIQAYQQASQANQVQRPSSLAHHSDLPVSPPQESINAECNKFQNAAFGGNLFPASQRSFIHLCSATTGNQSKPTPRGCRFSSNPWMGWDELSFQMTCGVTRPSMVLPLAAG